MKATRRSHAIPPSGSRSPRGPRGRAPRTLVPLALALLLVLLCAPPAGLSAQAGEAGDTITAEDARPFVTGGQWDKPYLTDVLGRVAVGGYAEAHTRFERVDGLTEELGFVAKRLNLFVASDVSEIVRFGAEIEFEEGAEEIILEFATVDLRIHPSLAFRAGMILSPLGRFNLAHDSPMNEFTDRPLVATELLGVALSEPGLGVFGTIPLGTRGARITYEAYGVNGFHAGILTDSPEGLRIPAGRRNFEDANRSPAFVGRLAGGPGPGWELGVSAHHGAWNEFEEEGLELDRRRDLTIWAVDFEASPGDVRIQGEAATAGIDLPPAISGVYASRQRGLFVEALRDFGRGWIPTLPDATFVTGVRLDAVDFDAGAEGDSVRQLSLGLGFRPGPGTALKLDYVRGRSFDLFRNPTDHAALLFSVATYF